MTPLDPHAAARAEDASLDRAARRVLEHPGVETAAHDQLRAVIVSRPDGLDDVLAAVQRVLVREGR